MIFILSYLWVFSLWATWWPLICNWWSFKKEYSILLRTSWINFFSSLVSGFLCGAIVIAEEVIIKVQRIKVWIIFIFIILQIRIKSSLIDLNNIMIEIFDLVKELKEFFLFKKYQEVLLNFNRNTRSKLWTKEILTKYCNEIISQFV